MNDKKQEGYHKEVQFHWNNVMYCLKVFFDIKIVAKYKSSAVTIIITTHFNNMHFCVISSM